MGRGSGSISPLIAMLAAGLDASPAARARWIESGEVCDAETMLERLGGDTDTLAALVCGTIERERWYLGASGSLPAAAVVTLSDGRRLSITVKRERWYPAALGSLPAAAAVSLSDELLGIGGAQLLFVLGRRYERLRDRRTLCEEIAQGDAELALSVARDAAKQARRADALRRMMR